MKSSCNKLMTIHGCTRPASTIVTSYAYSPLALLQRVCTYAYDTLVFPYIAHTYTTTTTLIVITGAYRSASAPTTATAHSNRHKRKSSNKQAIYSTGSTLSAACGQQPAVSSHTYDASMTACDSETAPTPTTTYTTAIINIYPANQSPPTTHSLDYYYGYRYYSPELGRWVSRDPLAEQGARLGFADLPVQHRELVHLDDIKVVKFAAFSPTFGYNTVTLHEPQVSHIFTQEDFVRSVQEVFRSGLSITPISLKLKNGFAFDFTSHQQSAFNQGSRWDAQFTSDAKLTDLYVFVHNSPPDRFDALGLRTDGANYCLVAGCICPAPGGGDGCSSEWIASPEECKGNTCTGGGMSWPCQWYITDKIGI